MTQVLYENPFYNHGNFFQDYGLACYVAVLPSLAAPAKSMTSWLLLGAHNFTGPLND